MSDGADMETSGIWEGRWWPRLKPRFLRGAGLHRGAVFEVFYRRTAVTQKLWKMNLRIKNIEKLSLNVLLMMWWFELIKLIILSS